MKSMSDITKKLIKMYEATETKTIETDEGLKSVEEFSQAEGFQWTESPMGKVEVKEYIDRNKNEIEEQQFKNLVKQSCIDIGIVPKNNSSVDDMLAILGYQPKKFKQAQKKNSEKIKDFLENPNRNKNLIVRKINDIVGKGVFLKKNGESIKKHTIVSVYTGEYENMPPEEKFHSYALDLPPHIIFGDTSSSSSITGILNAEKYGNISRYFNDLPTDEELQEYYNISPELYGKIATANLELFTTYYQYCPNGYFSSIKDITEGQFGFSYGGAYFARAEYLYGTKRCLFYKDGSGVVDEKYYQSKFYNLQVTSEDGKRVFYFPIKIKDLKHLLVNNKDYRFIDTRSEKQYDLTPDQLLSALVKKISGIDPKQEDFYKFRFSCSIKLILQDFIVENAYKKDALDMQRLSYVKKLQEDIIHLEDIQSDKIFKAVANILNDKTCKTFYSENLKELRQEIIQVMKKYNADVTANNEKQKSEQLVDENRNQLGGMGP